MKNRPCAIAWFGTACLMLSVGCKRGDTIGQLCDLTVDAGPSQAVVNLEAATCRTGLCLKPVLASGASAIDPLTGATCTDECTSDSDCDGEHRNPSDAEDTRCAGGFACGVPFVVGPLCCKRYCLCRDFLGPSGTQTPVACQGPDALAICQSAAGSAAATGIGQQTDMYISVSPVRQLDMVFMIDNSPSMAPKVSKLAQQFPKLLDVLKDPNDGRYPDLRVAIIDSDLGTGGAYQSGSCGPTASPDASRIFGDLGNFQMRGAAACGANPDALWLDRYLHGKPATHDLTLDMSQVFGCLAGNLGALGCGQEHQLQSFEFALAAPNLHQSQSGGLQNTFLRPQAYLGLVILSDEDDCSAATNAGMFGDKPELRGESTSLRCATRAHQCNGVNLSDAPPGYPTSGRFEANFADCAARTDACPNPTDGNAATDTSGPTPCSPLKDIHHLAEEIKALKAYPDNQIAVAGIFGWPRTGTNGLPDMANAKYKIDLVPGPRPEDADNQQGQVWDYWPVCYDPDHEPAAPATFDADAWGWGAPGGLRIVCLHRRVRRQRPQVQHLRAGLLASHVAVRQLDSQEASEPLHRCEADGRRSSDPRAATRLSRGLSRARGRCHDRPAHVHRIATVAADLSGRRHAGHHSCPTAGSWSSTTSNARSADSSSASSERPRKSPTARCQAGTKIGMQCWTCPDSTSRPGCDY